tara:strand:+ start:473 stop:595 length:123 start_codon:yes stop_codon:yes gene_type:complete
LTDKNCAAKLGAWRLTAKDTTNLHKCKSDGKKIYKKEKVK